MALILSYTDMIGHEKSVLVMQELSQFVKKRVHECLGAENSVRGRHRKRKIVCVATNFSSIASYADHEIDMVDLTNVARETPPSRTSPN